MIWFFLEQGKQHGPLSDEQVVDMVAQGRIHSATLIWHEGLADWQTYAYVSARGSAPALLTPVEMGLDPTKPPPPPPPLQLCSQCSRQYLVDDILLFDNAPVCINCKPYFFQRLKEGFAQRSAILLGQGPQAGFWIRTLAMVVDLTIMGLAGWLIHAVLFGFGNFIGVNGPLVESEDLIAPVILGEFMVGVFLSTWLVGMYGATVGKMACGLKVVRADGGRVGYGLALGRYFAEWLSALALGLGFLMIAFDKQSRALHDHMCGTMVVARY